MITRILTLISVLIVPGITTYSQDIGVVNQNTDSRSSGSSQSHFKAEGNWRGIFKISPTVEVPFNFQITSDGKKKTVYLVNGEEKFETGRYTQISDSVYITLDPFDNELALGIKGEELSGYLRRQNKSGTPVPVSAVKENFRFADNGVEAAANYSGTYDIVFTPTNGKEEKAVGLFSQKGNKLSVSFLRITGDSRYLEGIVQGNNFYLSSFIGSGPSYYKGSFTSKSELKGAIVGARGELNFNGVLNENAALPDPTKLTYLKEGYKSLDFSFPDVHGNLISPKDKKYKDKILILTITGTWCPNCIDEAHFLAPWYKKNRSRGVEAIAIHYERQTDSAYVRKALTKFRDKYGIQYDQVIAGTADKQIVAASIPALNTFLSFPTIIIIDKKGEVRKIHTGFSGPATGKYYDEFVKEFDQTIAQLLKE